jgi:hypothetical protein
MCCYIRFWYVDVYVDFTYKANVIAQTSQKRKERKGI